MGTTSYSITTFRFLMIMATWVFVRVSPSSFAVVVTLRPSAVSSWSEVSTIIREGQFVVFCVFYASILKPDIFVLLVAFVGLFSPWKVRPVWTLSRCFWPCSLFWLSPWDAIGNKNRQYSRFHVIMATTTWPSACWIVCVGFNVAPIWTINRLIS